MYSCAVFSCISRSPRRSRCGGDGNTRFDSQSLKRPRYLRDYIFSSAEDALAAGDVEEETVEMFIGDAGNDGAEAHHPSRQRLQRLAVAERIVLKVNNG